MRGTDTQNGCGTKTKNPKMVRRTIPCGIRPVCEVPALAEVAVARQKAWDRRDWKNRCDDSKLIAATANKIMTEELEHSKPK